MPKTIDPPKKTEKLLAFIAEESFIDGNLAEHFGQYGYDVLWPRNEIRNIPMWLAQRVINSGGNLTPADG